MRCRPNLEAYNPSERGVARILSKDVINLSFARRALLRDAFSFDALCYAGAFYSNISDMSAERKSLTLSCRTAVVAAVAATHHPLEF